MCADHRRPRAAWAVFVLLLAAGRVPGQVIELGAPRPATEEAMSPPLKPDEARALATLPDCRPSSYRRSFDGQVIRIDIFRFDQPEAAFSLFTFMQRPGAKPMSDLVGCYLQEQEMVVWRGRTVLRTVFEQVARAHLSEYYEWLSEQFQSQEPVPDLYLKLPVEGLDRPSRRYLIRDSQLPLLTEALAGTAAEVGLNRGNRLAVARYRGAAGVTWSGWLSPVSADDAAQLLTRFESADTMPRLKRMGERLAFYLGPADPDSVTAAFARLEEAARHPEASGEIDLTRFFRRDNYSYADLVLAALRFVGLMLLLALGAGALVYGAVIGSRRIRRRPDGLAAENVVRLHLDGVTGSQDHIPISGPASPSPES
ncbi:MAG TPA: hypothetical protein PLY66_12370 [Acidobacteriota bacterium]|nr:hypothetical protein [Acidobacteriota bacterium]HQF86865.1 hypothetical protein [Acidobacteriota bacterium]HQG91337.1 hypothetical protein [Acidobacteriota bacterium]HQK87410.1 hypothetical protein [Acidobacteriota bacterium]